MSCGDVHYSRPYTRALMGAMGFRVDQKGMIPTVSCDVHEANKGAIVQARSNPPKTVRTDPIHQPAAALPPCAFTNRIISASVTGPRQQYVIPSRTSVDCMSAMPRTIFQDRLRLRSLS